MKKKCFSALPRKYFPPNRIKEGNILCERNPINTRVIQPQENLHRQYDCSLLSLSHSLLLAAAVAATIKQHHKKIEKSHRHRNSSGENFHRLRCCGAVCAPIPPIDFTYTRLYFQPIGWTATSKRAREREKKLKISYSADSLFSSLEH